MAERSVFELLFEALGTDKVKSQIAGMDSAVKQLDTAFGDLIKGMAAGLAGALSAKAFVDISKASLDAADSIGKLAQQMGMTVEEASVLEYTLGMADVSAEELSTSVKGLNKSLEEAEKPGTAAANAFKAFGLNAKELQNLNVDQRLKVIAEQFSKFADGPQKSAAAVEMFGKSGLKLIPLLNQGAAGFEAARAEAERLGLILNKDLTDAADSVNDSFDKIGRTLRAAWIKGMQDSLPEIQKVNEAMAVLATKGSSVQVVFTGIVGFIKVLVTAFYGLVNAIATTGKMLGAMAAAFVALLRGDFAGAKEIVGAFGQDLAAAGKELADFTTKLWSSEQAAKQEAATTKEGAKAKVEYSGATKEAKVEVDKAIEATDKLIAKMREEIQTMGMTKEQKEATVAINQAMLIQNEQIRNAKLAEIQGLETELVIRRAVYDAEQRATEINEEAQRVREDAVKTLETTVETLELEVRTLGMSNAQKIVTIQLEKDRKAGVDQTTEAYMKQIAALGANTQKIDDFAALNKQKSIEIANFWELAAKGMQSSFSTFFFDIMQGKTTDLVGSIKQMLDRIIAEMLAAKLTMELFGATPGTISSGNSSGYIGAAVQSFFGGFRAGGGSVEAGVPYVVGEQRPELFVPKTDGYILPDANQALAGTASNNNINITVQAMDSQDVIRSIDKVKRQVADIVAGTRRSYNVGAK